MRPAASGKDGEQAAKEIAAAITTFLTAHPVTLVLEDGKVLFDLRDAQHTLSTEHGRCTLQLWNAERNLVRRISAVAQRKAVLRLTCHRMGQAKPTVLELAGDRERRTVSTREAVRERYVRVLERSLTRHFPGCRAEAFRTAMDLERSFGPAYARGLLLEGRVAWAVIGANREEAQTTLDGILTLGILWLEECRGRREIAGLRVMLPPGTAATTQARMAWLAGSGWELYTLDEQEEVLTRLDPADTGNLHTHLAAAPQAAAVRERFADAIARVLALLLPPQQPLADVRVRSGTEIAFCLHGLEFARVRLQAAAQNFNRVETITVGSGAEETELTPATETALRALLLELFRRRSPDADARDPLFRMNPERWLESEVRKDLAVLDPRLRAAPIYREVPAFAAADRAMLDLLATTKEGRLAVLELKAAEDLHLALQGLDYWIRVRYHHIHEADPLTGRGELQRKGYFSDLHLQAADPHLYLVAPALHIHPATETVLRHLSLRVPWTLVALDERWRHQLRVVWRKHSPS